MRVAKSFSVLLALLLVAGMAAYAEDKPADAGAETAAAKSDADKPAKKLRLTKPWSGLDTLSEDQKQKISDIHAQAIAEIKAIQEREREQIMALLTAEQKAQIEEMAAQDKVKRKSKAAEKPAGEVEEAEADKPEDSAGM